MTLKILLKDSFVCPRRYHIADTKPDNWSVGSSLSPYDKDLNLLHCSYCGSLHPDIFMDLIQQDYYIIPTDKDYKAYLAKPPAFNNAPTTSDPNEITHGDTIAKFYLMHLSKAQRIQFIELVNEKQVKFGFPGYFYITPYFTTRGIS